MKQTVLYFALGAVVLVAADKPSPTFNGAASASAPASGAGGGGGYGSPKAPSVGGYGSPKAPSVGGYGSPKAPSVGGNQETYGSPQASPVHAPAAAAAAPSESVAASTQGFYYYYYPVASTSQQESGNQVYSAPASAPSTGYDRTGLGDFSGVAVGLIGFLVMLAVVLAAVSFTTSSKRSFSDVFTADLDDLAQYAYEGIRLWTELQKQ